MLKTRFPVSERRACRLVGQYRATQRYPPTQRAGEDARTQAIVALAAEYGRYDYRRVSTLLNAKGGSVGKDRVARIWRREALKSLEEAKIVIEQWRYIYNTRRPHSSLGYRPPAALTSNPKPMLIEQRPLMQ